MGNSDPFLTYLKSFGYSVVRLPRTDIRPLQVLVKEDTRLTRLGDLETILRPGTQIPLPKPKENVAAASISGGRTRDLGIGVGLSILGSVIGAMGGSQLGLDVSYKNAKTALFEFADVLEDRVELAEIDQYLTDADISAFSSHAARLLEADAVYVTVSTIKSRKFIVQAKEASGVPVELKLPVIQTVVGASVKVSAAGTTDSRIAYQGAEPLVFGFQAARLFYEDGRYTSFAPMRPGDAALEARRASGDARADFLVTDSPFVRLDIH
jgi:hypothetical protein